jgi:hypothetical protein
MNRPLGVTLLAIGAGVAGLFQIWRIVVFLGIASFNVIGNEVSFQEPQWGQAIWAGVMAAIWFWVASGFWGVRAYAWQFGIFISLFTMIFGFFSILASNTTTEFEMIGWLISIAIFFYLNYPGVRNTFMEHEMSLLTPEQRVAVEAAQRAQIAAAQAMAAPAAPAAATPAPAAAAPAAAPAAPTTPPSDTPSAG